MKRDIFIFTDGAIKREQNTLKYYNEDKKRFLPVEDIHAIYAFGEIEFNKRMLELLSQKEIILHYFNYYGYYMGSFYPREHYNSGFMILHQAESYNDERMRVEIAQGFVSGAIKNMVQVLKYYKENGSEITVVIDQLEAYLGMVEETREVGELLGIEGNARNSYYNAFDYIISVDGFDFGKRTRRPPENHLNALISFGNTILYPAILSEIYKTHLDPRIGFLHATNFRSFSLNLDVAEIFKPIIIDRIIFTMVNKKIIKKGDFEKDSNGLFLKENARRKFVEHFDERLNQTLYHRELGRKVSYRTLIRMECYKLEKQLMGEKTYQPYVSKW